MHLVRLRHRLWCAASCGAAAISGRRPPRGGSFAIFETINEPFGFEADDVKAIGNGAVLMRKASAV